MAQAAVLTNGTKTTVPDSARNSHAMAPSLDTNKRRKLGNGLKFYGVKGGKNPGVYNTWDECKAAVTGKKNDGYKAFASYEDADAFSRGITLPGMPQSGKVKYYAVQNGRRPGVYTDWPTAKAQIEHWKMPKYKSFDNEAEARDYAAGGPKKTKPVKADEQINSQILPQQRDLLSRSAPGMILGGQHTPKDTYGYQFEVGTGPLPPGAEDGFDPNIKLDAEGNVGRKTEAEKSKTKMQNVDRKGDMMVIYTDGSSLSNGRAGARAGVGVYFGPADPRNVSEALRGVRQTNQRAELTAISRALDIAPRNRIVTIYTDSKYGIDCVTNWYKTWQRNGWVNAKGKPVENKDLIADIRIRIEERERLDKATCFMWVKGHANNPGNHAADELAVAGSRMSRGIDADVEGEEEVERAEAAEEIAGNQIIPDGIDDDSEAEEAFRQMERAMNGGIA